MIHRLKLPGLAAMAVLASLALSAPAANAAEFHLESAPATVLDGSSTTSVITTDPGKVTCKKVSMSGTQSSTTASQLTVTPTAEECTLSTIFGNIAVSMNFNGCDYLYTASGEMHVVCPAGKNIVVSGPGCTVTIPAQTLNGLKFTNEGSGTTRHFTLHVNAAGVVYAYSGFTCGSGSNTSNGTYTGTTTVTASASIFGIHIGFWWQ